MNSVLITVLLVSMICITIKVATTIVEDNIIQTNPKDIRNPKEITKTILLEFIYAIRNYIHRLFYRKNIFGKIINSIILILSIPGILFVIVTALIICVYVFLVVIYKLGDMK